MGDAFKLGDRVIVVDHNGHPRRRAMVTREKVRFVELPDGTKWGKDGRPYPKPSSGISYWEANHLRHATPELSAEFERRRDLYFLQRVNWDRFSAAQLREVVGAVKRFKAEDPDHA